MRRLFFHEESIHEVSRRYLEHEYIHTYIHTYVHTYGQAETNMPPHFFKVGGITMMGWSPRCYIPSFVDIGPPVPEKKIFEGFLPHTGVVPILVMGPASCHQIFINISLYLKAFIQILVKIRTVVSGKLQFEFLYVHNLGQRSRNDLDLHIFN